MCTLKDWAALISAILWPSIVLIVLFRIDVKDWVKGITNAELFGFKMTRFAETTKATATALSSTSSDFDRISPLLDWNKVSEEVRKWAARHYAPDAGNMGPENFRRFLFDYGLPGGQQTELKWIGEGSNKSLIYQ